MLPYFLIRKLHNLSLKASFELRALPLNYIGCFEKVQFIIFQKTVSRLEDEIPLHTSSYERIIIISTHSVELHDFFAAQILREIDFALRKCKNSPKFSSV